MKFHQSELALISRVTDETVADETDTDGEEEDCNEGRDDVTPHIETVIREGNAAAVFKMLVSAPAQNRS